jgi:hypothetical protein
MIVVQNATITYTLPDGITPILGLQDKSFVDVTEKIVRMIYCIVMDISFICSINQILQQALL